MKHAIAKLTVGAIIVLCASISGQAASASPVSQADTLSPSVSQGVALPSSTADADPDKGGPAGACSMMSLNARMHSKSCNPRLSTTKAVLDRCAKLSIAAGFVAAGSVAVATTPLDWPGVVATGSFTFAGTEFFCQADWI